MLKESEECSMENSDHIDKDGATAVITHRVRDGQQDNYEQWLLKVIPLCRTYPGHLDWQVIRPVSGLTATYTVIIRFDTHDHLLGWLHSSDRKLLIEEARPFLATDDNFYTQSGLDFLFEPPEGVKANVPNRWKQFLVTWIAIYPVSLLSQLVIAPGLQQIGVPQNRFLTTLILTGIVVYLMIYLIMPRFTQLLKRWLYK
jgi:antibiotic biosynthesis monooxygenase (ABM) superfamily enzyme